MGLTDFIKGKLGYNQQPQMMPEMMMSPQVQIAGGNNMADYPESFWRQQENIKRVDSQQDMINLVHSSLLSVRCKKAFHSIIVNLYDDNVILSNHENQIRAEISFLKAQVYLGAFLQANSYKSDILNPAWGLLYNEILYQTELRFTRTVGTDRERVAQGKVTQVHEVSSGYHPYNRGGSSSPSPCSKLG